MMYNRKIQDSRGVAEILDALLKNSGAFFFYLEV